MGIVLYQEPKLENPYLVASWPGIGNIGIIAVDALRAQLQAEELAEIEPWEFFYPRKVVIKSGILQSMEFPTNKFYYKKLERKDIILFIGEEQPTEGEKVYAEGKRAYRMASMVLDVASRFGCQRVYTSGAAVSLTHHTMNPRVWAVTSREDLIKEVKSLENTILMGEIEGSSGGGTITGLNGLLLGLAKKRGFEAICLMGEVPDYISAAPFPYPKASKAVLTALCHNLRVQADFSGLDEMAGQMDEIISGIYAKIPQEIREKIDQRRSIARPAGEPITEEDERWIKEHIDDLFRSGGKGDERAS